ncbi:MAG: hypothetical protein EOO47_11655 [Flavobacterium sp.]|nr:MAG: hypothetical protein EOO47_11655 [Flavobacterium sp.]
MPAENPSQQRQIETQYLISTNKFISLSILTMGLYTIWWAYKEWRFFQQKENRDLAPALRAIFGIVFLMQLFIRILNYTKKNGYQQKYAPTALFIFYLLSNFIGFLPDPFSFLVYLNVLFLVPPFEAINFAKRNATNVIIIEQDQFNTKQIVLLVIGLLLWMFTILLYLFPNQIYPQPIY